MSEATNPSAAAVPAVATKTKTTKTSSTTHCWLPKGGGGNDEIDCICLGTGRFLRSVLVPALINCNNKHHPVLVQPRGRTFLEYMIDQEEQDSSSSSSYPVDTVLPSGDIRTDYVPCYGAFSLGQTQDKHAFYDYLSSSSEMKHPSSSSSSSSKVLIVGVGVTEAGLANPNTQAMKDLYELLSKLAKLSMANNNNNNKWKDLKSVCVLDMDNVPNNGSVIQKHMVHLLAEDEGKSSATTTATTDDQIIIVRTFLNDKVSFHDTMVDRITSQRPGSNGMVPRCEPLPAKALVVLDVDNNERLQDIIFGNNAKTMGGVVIRTTHKALQADINLKLRVANGTHTAIAHVLALLGRTQTNDGLAVIVVPDDPDQQRDKQQLQQVPPITAVLIEYLDSLFDHQILPAAVAGLSVTCDDIIMSPEHSQQETQAVYDDWKRRLTHPHFGLSSFFITQNGAAKGGIRLGPTVIDLIRTQCDGDTNNSQHEQHQPVSVAMAFAFAVLLRWLTPGTMNVATAATATATATPTEHKDKISKPGIFRGWLQPSRDPKFKTAEATKGVDDESSTVEYADKLRYNLQEGWYEFRCACQVMGDDAGGGKERNLSEWLGSMVDGKNKVQQPATYVPVIRAYLISPDGGNMNELRGHPEFETLVKAIATLLARMIAGDDILHLLQEMKDKNEPYTDGLATSCSVLVDDRDNMGSGANGANGANAAAAPLHYKGKPIPDHSALMNEPVSLDTVASIIASEVASTQCIDLHTHLLPPTHGSLCLWGIDELLSYHYLVAEYFITAPASMTPEDFYAKTKKEQADIIWKALFIERTPISEACRGVVTTLVALGFSKKDKSRNLDAIRNFCKSYRDKGLDGAESFSHLVFSLAGIRYNIMTNIPFDTNEAQHWRPKRKDYSSHYRSALRVDPLLAGDRITIENSLKASGYETTLEGARQYLRDWCDTMSPEYLMASTPHDFVLKEEGGTLSNLAKKTGLNEDTMVQPGAFADVMKGDSAVDCNAAEEDTPSAIDEDSDFLSEVLMKICEERDLPIALKIGAHRGLNPSLKAAGDGVVAFADAGMLGRLCTRYPKVRFLATFLSRNNQHEACVLASKFRNLHLYGCWWYCNNPSIIAEMTKMRVEILGTSFTAQHSDARVLDQLIYKWAHSRSVIASVLQDEYCKLLLAGWRPSRSEIRRDVYRLFGGSYQEFMNKSLS